MMPTKTVHFEQTVWLQRDPRVELQPVHTRQQLHDRACRMAHESTQLSQYVINLLDII